MSEIVAPAAIPAWPQPGMLGPERDVEGAQEAQGETCLLTTRKTCEDRAIDDMGRDKVSLAPWTPEGVTHRLAASTPPGSSWLLLGIPNWQDSPCASCRPHLQMTICPDTWAMSVSPVASRLPEGAAWGLSSPSPMLHCVQGGDSHPKNYLLEQGSLTPEPWMGTVRNQPAQQEVSSRPASEDSSVFAAAPQR